MPFASGLPGVGRGHARGEIAAGPVTNSDKAWYRALLRRGSPVQIDGDLIDVTPAPSFRRVVAFDDRMAGGMEMLGRMAVGRAVATAHMAAGPAQPEVNPG